MGLFDKFKSKTDTKPSNGIAWKSLTTEAELEALIARSNTVPCVIFKHSTRCSISSMAHSRFERNWDIDIANAEPYYLDLIAFRSVSNKIAEILDVVHASPQVILVKNGKAIYNTSHNDITAEAIKEQLS